MPFLLTLPRAHTERLQSSEGKLYPLMVYLHSAGGLIFRKGKYEERQLEFVSQEAPHSVLIESGRTGVVDNFIGISPCCPPNMSVFQPYCDKSERQKQVFWFKSCNETAYMSWDFSAARRCPQVELAVIELLANVCEQLPVDPSRIYFNGISAGGYGVLRLAELLPELPAAVAPMAGYYPEMPAEDHDAETMAGRLQQVMLMPMHCELDKVCRLDRPDVYKAYDALFKKSGVMVEMVEPSTASGSGKSYHSPQKIIFKDPDAFFNRFLLYERPSREDPVVYLRQRLLELG